MTASDVVVGILHPGSMGAAVAGQLRRVGVRVLWHPEGRSKATAERAEAAGLEAVSDLGSLVEQVDVLISLCPPAAAEEVARLVAGSGLAGKVYVEANAVAPRRVRDIACLLEGATVVDAAVVGSPPVGGKQPRLYAAGPADAVSGLAAVFAPTDVRVHPLGETIGRASALKLAYTGYQKASRVLAALSYGVAEANGIGGELLDIAAQRPGSYLTETGYIPKTAARAWRWGPEMDEAAELLAEAGLPEELMHAASAVLSRWSGARDADLSIAEALRHLHDAT